MIRKFSLYPSNARAFLGNIVLIYMFFEILSSTFFTTAYVADWKVQLDAGKPHEVKDHSVEVSL